MTDHTYNAFFALHHRLPRQNPGSDATTRRLLALAGPLPDRPRVLDLGCGPGRAALLLAAEAGAEVTAVDLHQPFLDELTEAAGARGLGDRIRTVRADMADLDGPGFADGSYDLVWAEGSAYIVGFDTALRDWRRLLAPGGTMVITECVWTTGSPSAGARAFWDRHASLRPVAGNTAAAVEAGFHVLGVLVQPDSDWDEYYVPLAARTATADPSAPGMPEALAATREELDVRHRYGAEYGYAGYVLRPSDPRWRTRPETAADRAAVHEVVAAAFPTRDEADLVDALRTDPDAWLPGLSYVAEAPDGSVAAHALLTRCRVGDAPALALAPVATTPAHQRSGAGRAVVRAVLDAARLRGESLVLVLGHPEYYPAFGFVPASRFGIRPGFEVPDEAMMALVLDDSGPVPGGTIRYPAAFGV
ncbi:bifunctional class I SAM-dependent methyltransferase/N-acetyltransferase [Streptomyces sp. NE06-03E]|uniref:GNAT family N-acetyltransferase n=1 Tax=Streptomyces sp. gb1(2016) TaxID=1828321 RepID=A0A652LBN7_9ACTN|nr:MULTISPECIES: bifunctional class I SAM-dependent methyltransferase/N-acetyltransferase [unclassified Streptomyces]MDX3057631.1 bifunctional class I SAM-dependent methyltransferase/N-acetyltransferase [Streptomyces sp. NE06-03E]MDX3685211.1 bifunctional class I SAM-dependent methyltransferase/N-acetyltransferase [Streptomyces sp. AK04-4c]TXS32568.1 GNAT family N-acetyltransferase [Streptomyces sp. gb1(2016)]WSS65589.1 bifunctional class I SAM-dependent methyltransferase/N-acetyltransferase [S